MKENKDSVKTEQKCKFLIVNNLTRSKQRSNLAQKKPSFTSTDNQSESIDFVSSLKQPRLVFQPSSILSSHTIVNKAKTGTASLIE